MNTLLRKLLDRCKSRRSQKRARKFFTVPFDEWIRDVLEEIIEDKFADIIEDLIEEKLDSIYEEIDERIGEIDEERIEEKVEERIEEIERDNKYQMGYLVENWEDYKGDFN